MKALMTIHPTQQDFDDWLVTQKAEDFDEDDLD